MKKDSTKNAAQLGNLLERYKNHFKPPQSSVEKVCIEVIKDVCGITLQTHQIVYNVSSHSVYIKAPSLLRSELLLHTDVILSECSNRLSLDSVPKSIL